MNTTPAKRRWRRKKPKVLPLTPHVLRVRKRLAMVIAWGELSRDQRGEYMVTADEILVNLEVIT